MCDVEPTAIAAAVGDIKQSLGTLMIRQGELAGAIGGIEPGRIVDALD
jgi:hypothetical protein